MTDSKILEITARIEKRSEIERQKYLDTLNSSLESSSNRNRLSCGNLAHGMAGCSPEDKDLLSEGTEPNLGLITAYNDMLSAHKTYESYPQELRSYATEMNATIQVAGATPAMCDGVTQGRPGMDLSLLSRDIIALSSAIGLSHDMFDGVMNLGICDKIVPGLLIGNLQFGHLPSIFVPGGPMESGISNDQKAKIRQDFAEGKISREELLKGESDSYHSPGTCTFYGTANSNQMLMEIMGLQLPGSSFVNPNTAMRSALNKEAVSTLLQNVRENDGQNGIGFILNEKTLVNGIVGLLATGGSTNHTLHLVAIAKACGIKLIWDDIAELSDSIPLIARVYPNGAADINHFHASGGMAYVIKTLLDKGLLHKDVRTVIGQGLDKYTLEPKLINGEISYESGPEKSLNNSIIRAADNPFQKSGGLKVLKGNLGVSIIKSSSVAPEHQFINAPAIVFDHQDALIEQFKADKLNKDFIAVLPFQGPKQKGMPELHKLTPTLTVLQKRGYNVGVVTDGRMSGASGKVPAAIHLSPEAADGGIISRIKNGDNIILDIENGTLECSEKELNDRPERTIKYEDNSHGRNLFASLRTLISKSEDGAGIL